MKHLNNGEHHNPIRRWAICSISAVIITCVILATSIFTSANVDSSHASAHTSASAPAVQQEIVIQMSETVVATAPSTVPTVEPTSVPEDADNESESNNETYNYCDDTDLLARLIYLEAGSCSENCQWLVGSAAMNLADAYGGLSNVAYNPDKFSVADSIDYCDPSPESYEVAARVLSGDRDYAVNAFRTDYFHEWADPYIAMEEDNVYFSTY